MLVIKDVILEDRVKQRGGIESNLIAGFLVAMTRAVGEGKGRSSNAFELLVLYGMKNSFKWV